MKDIVNIQKKKWAIKQRKTCKKSIHIHQMQNCCADIEFTKYHFGKRHDRIVKIAKYKIVINATTVHNISHNIYNLIYINKCQNRFTKRQIYAIFVIHFDIFKILAPSKELGTTDQKEVSNEQIRAFTYYQEFYF